MTLFKHILHSDTILSCSVGTYENSDDHIVYEFNDDGPVYGPNGELELDPDNDQCKPCPYCSGYTRPVFATCKNNCPGGELSELFSNNYKHQQTNSIFLVS